MNQTSELSEREIEILKLVATGLSNKEIAYQLKISPNTVKVHLKNIFSKIGVVSRTEAAMFAVRQGWVEAGSQVALEAIEAQESGDLPKAAQIAFPPLILGLLGIGLFAAMIILVVLLVNLASRGNPQVVEIVVTPTPEPVKWELVTQMPEPKKSMAYAAVDNKIYIIGGETPEGISDRVDIYDTVTGQWSEGARKPTPVSEACGLTLGNEIFVIGGKLRDGLYTDVVEAYDWVEDRWNLAGKIPAQLGGMSCIAHEGKSYVLGGWDGQGVYKNIWSFQPSDKEWKTFYSLEEGRAYFGAINIGKSAYLAGGWDGKNELNTLDTLTLQGDTLSRGDTIYLPERRERLTLLNVLDKLYVLGGKNAESKMTTSLEYQPLKDMQRSIANPNEEEWASLGAVAIGEYLYGFGGELGGALSDRLFRLRVLYTVVLPVISK